MTFTKCVYSESNADSIAMHTIYENAHLFYFCLTYAVPTKTIHYLFSELIFKETF